MGFWKYAQEDPGYLAIVDPDGTEHAAGDVLARANQVVHALRAPEATLPIMPRQCRKERCVAATRRR